MQALSNVQKYNVLL